MNGISILPLISLEIDERPLIFDHQLVLNTIQVHQVLSLPSVCELSLYVQQAEHLPTLEVGMALELAVSGQTLFTGSLVAIETHYQATNGCELILRAYDALHSLQNTQAMQAHLDFDLEELAQDLVLPLGLVVISHEASPRWERVFQLGQSHYHFLVELAQGCGLYLVLKENTLHLISLDGFGDALPLTFHDNLLEARFEQNRSVECQSVQTQSWNTHLVEAYTEEITQARNAAMGVAVPIGGRGQHQLIKQSSDDSQQVQAQAQAARDFYAAQARSMWAVVEGDATLQVGRRVTVEGLAAHLNGRYVLTHVKHHFSEQTGYVCEVDTRPPALIAAQRPQTSLAFGIVTAIDDPQNTGRICLRLPAYNDLETAWLQVLHIGGGSNKGFTILPDIGDKVLVIFEQGQAEHGIVLGGLQGVDPLADNVIANNTVHRYSLRMRDGQVVYLDADSDTIRFQNRDGSYLEMTPRNVRLHASARLVIEAPGYPVIIRGDTIDFQKG